MVLRFLWCDKQKPDMDKRINFKAFKFFHFFGVFGGGLAWWLCWCFFTANGHLQNKAFWIHGLYDWFW